MRSRRRRLRWSTPADDGVATPEVNTTPLIDVLLVLLVVLIVTAALRLNVIDASASAGHAAAPVPVVEVHVGPGRQLRWNGAAVTSPRQLQRLLTALARRGDRVQLQIRSDPSARYGTFAAVLAMARRAGLTRLDIVEAAGAPP